VRKEAPTETRAAKPRRILVVDDNVDAAQTLAMLVRLAGHQVEVAHDGRTTLKLAAQFRPHVILLDIGLPGMSGYEIARQLRRRPDGDRPLLVAVSGYGRDDDLRQAQEAGFDHHFTKPTDFEELRALLVSTPAPTR